MSNRQLDMEIGILACGMQCIPETQRLKNLPAMQETWVQFLGGEDSLEKVMATHSNILVWKIP